MELLEFAHKEGETANATIERFEGAMKFCGDEAVKVDDEQARRMLIGRCAERYNFLKQAYLLAPDATRPNIETHKAQMRDVDADF